MKRSGLFLLLLFCQIAAAEKANIDMDPNARDLVLLTKWFEGEFDNDSQIWLEGRRDWKGLPEEKHQRVHTIHRRVSIPHLGNHVFYVEEYVDDDPEKITRQRLVSFASDQEVAGIRMSIFFLKHPERFVLASTTSDVYDEIDEAAYFAIDGCDVIFKRQGEQYHGAMEAKSCQFGEGELRRYSDHQMVISKSQYWRIDRTFLVKNDQFYKGHPNDEPYKMRKVTYYHCDVSFYEEAYYIRSEKDKHYKEIAIHNQGGMEWFDNPISGKKYGVQLREKEYPFYAEGSDFFMIRFIEEGKKASDVIVTAQPHAKSVSFQIGWASVHCKMLAPVD